MLVDAVPPGNGMVGTKGLPRIRAVIGRIEGQPRNGLSPARRDSKPPARSVVPFSSVHSGDRAPIAGRQIASPTGRLASPSRGARLIFETRNNGAVCRFVSLLTRPA